MLCRNISSFLKNNQNLHSCSRKKAMRSQSQAIFTEFEKLSVDFSKVRCLLQIQLLQTVGGDTNCIEQCFGGSREVSNAQIRGVDILFEKLDISKKERKKQKRRISEIVRIRNRREGGEMSSAIRVSRSETRLAVYRASYIPHTKISSRLNLVDHNRVPSVRSLDYHIRFDYRKYELQTIIW